MYIQTIDEAIGRRYVFNKLYFDFKIKTRKNILFIFSLDESRKLSEWRKKMCKEKKQQRGSFERVISRLIHDRDTYYQTVDGTYRMFVRI